MIDPYICTCEIVLAGANVVRWERTSPCDSLRIAPKKLELCASCCKPITLPRISHITKPELETLPKPHQDAVKLTQHWLEDMVVGLNLCPFSASVIARDQVYFAVCDAEDDVDLHQFFLSELERLLGTNENEIATSLLIFTQGQEAFDDYLSLLDWFQQLLEQAELTGYVQLASFHPQYQFEGVAPDDLSHFTNRAPYPIVHLLRQDQMTKVLSHVAEPNKIYEDNIKTLKQLGRRKVEELCPWGK